MLPYFVTGFSAFVIGFLVGYLMHSKISADLTAVETDAKAKAAALEKAAKTEADKVL